MPKRKRRFRDDGYRVVWEDRDLIVVDKEPGIVVAPTPIHDRDTLVHRLLERESGRGVRDPKLWLIHRIDRYTSGLVVLGRNPSVSNDLIAQFRRREPRREYLAVCEGIPRRPRGQLSSRLMETAKSHKVYETTSRHGLPAVSNYSVEERLRGAALVRVSLHTGRRHQIRAQFAGMGHPLVGDRAYGRRSHLIDRVALHATELGFKHPKTGKHMTLQSPLPNDIKQLLSRLGRRRKA